jgi:hypothetical protein
MKTVFIKLKDGNTTSSKAITINDSVTLNDSFIGMFNYLDKDTVGLLVHFKQQQINLLNLTKVSPYVLLFFDDNLIYKGATHSIKNGIGNFIIQTQYKLILFIKVPHNLILDNIISLSVKLKKFKYLNYVPAPVYLEPNMYDLVDDKEFCRPDGRTPLLITIQYGIFPAAGFKGKKDYSQLEGLENQTVGFICRGYLSKRECKDIIELPLDPDTLRQIRNKELLPGWKVKGI